MSRWLVRGSVLVALASLCIAGSPWHALADHESTNLLTFAPGPGSPSSAATGSGRIEFKGGSEPQSRWTATFQFEGLEADTQYSVVVQGRFGEDESEEATAFSEICAFRTDEAGTGGCWQYFMELRRLGVVELRHTDGDDTAVLAAVKKDGAPGSIERIPNSYSPSPTATVPATPS